MSHRFHVFRAANLSAVGLLAGAFVSTPSPARAEATTETSSAEAPVADSAFADEDSGGFRKCLETRGLSASGNFTGDFLGSVGGGFSDGSQWAGLVELELEADLDALFGWSGVSFFTNAFYFRGGDLSGKHVGDFNGVSNTYSDTEFNVFNIYLTQSFRDERYGWKAGQIAVDDDFMVAESALLFVNSVFGPLPIQSGNIAAPIYPLAAPGALVYAEPVEGWFFQGAVYAGDAGPEESGNQGFEWQTGGSAGWAWFGETGFHHSALAGGTVKVGGFRATGEFTRFDTGETERGLSGFYAIADQRLLSAEDSAFGLSVFLRGGFAPDREVAVVRSYVDGGVVFDNLFLANDALGFAVSQTRFGGDYRNSMHAAGEIATAREWVLETTYQFYLTDWMTVQPDLQWVLDPHFSGEDALVAGIRVELSL